jgi:DNA-binding NarL/FixJ family response regulator
LVLTDISHVDLSDSEVGAMEHIRVTVVASDPLLAAGARSALDSCPEIEVTEPGDDASVAVAIVEEVDHRALDVVHAARQQPTRPEVVLVASELEPTEALHAIAAGAHGLLRRSEADEDRLARTVFTVAAGDCSVPPDMLDSMVEDPVEDEGPGDAGRNRLGLDDRETRVLALLAEGRETEEIARELNYSPRTVTTIVHDILHRFRLRNRAHAVAYALKAGLL